ncbi:MAG: alpha/beta fold hydrolase [Enhydrobacter sp.]
MSTHELFPGFSPQHIDAAGARIHCMVGGSGPPLLLLHGYPQTHAMWHRVAPALAREFTVVCPDLRGYGDSSKPASDARHATYSKRAMALDMVEVMRTGLFMERVRRENGRLPTPEQALRWATRNGYKALGIPDGGWLAPGNKADLVVVDMNRAHLIPMLRAVSDFVHNGQARDVESVMVDGRWLMRDCKVLVMDEDAVLSQAQHVARTAWSRQFRSRLELPRPAGFIPDMLP